MFQLLQRPEQCCTNLVQITKRRIDCGELICRGHTFPPVVMTSARHSIPAHSHQYLQNIGGLYPNRNWAYGVQIPGAMLQVETSPPCKQLQVESKHIALNVG